jgi:Ala-tRNA(Pro) deacylase
MSVNTVEPRPGVAPHEGLLQWLRTHGVDYEIHEHAPSVTALETAHSEGIDVRRFAKCVGVVTAEGRHALLVVDAAERVDLGKACEVLDTEHVRLLSEAELAELAPDCEIGAIPPIGELWGLPVYADSTLRSVDMVSFHAGSHRFTVHVERSPWVTAAHVIYGDLAADDGRPAWARH